MRIAQVNINKVNNAYGGTEKIFIEMANELTRRGHEVISFYYDTQKGSPVFPIHPDTKVINCYKGFILKIKNSVAKLFACFLFNKTLRHLARYYFRDNEIFEHVKSCRPDIIINYFPDSNLTYLNKLSIPIIQMLHMDPSYLLAKPIVVALKKELTNISCIQVLMPQFIKDVYKIIPNKNIIYIPNTVRQFEKASSLDKKTIVFIGRIAKEKRIELLIKAFSVISSKHEDWNVEIWGANSRIMKIILVY